MAAHFFYPREYKSRLFRKYLNTTIAEYIIRLSSHSIHITGNASNRTKPYTVKQMQKLCSGIPAVKSPQDRTYLVLQAVHPLYPEEMRVTRNVIAKSAYEK